MFLQLRLVWVKLRLGLTKVSGEVVGRLEDFGTPRRLRLAGAERASRVSQFVLNPHCDRVRATEYAPRDPFQFLERRHGLAELVERGAGVL